MVQDGFSQARGFPLVALSLTALLACQSEVATPAASGPSAQCVGPSPPADAWQAKPGPEGVAGLPAAVTGAAVADFALTDFQPQSCGIGATYGLSAFRGRVTVIALFAGWCSYCITQNGMLERMRGELETAGYPVYFVTINKADAAANQQALVDRCAFPLLQDTDAVNAWARLGGQKDDFFILDAQGVIVDYLPLTGDRPTNLSMHGGYDALKSAIVAVAAKK